MLGSITTWCSELQRGDCRTFVFADTAGYPALTETHGGGGDDAEPRCQVLQRSVRS
jgi:hypothetical protein